MSQEEQSPTHSQTASSFLFTGLGGTSEVGASCYLYQFGDTKLLIDAGTRPNALGLESLPALDSLTEAPDALLVTHAHSDHIGAIPLLIKRFPKLPIFATRPTSRIALDMLKDAVKVMTSQGAPLYSLPQVSHALARVQEITPLESFTVGSVTITPLPAGHLLGAVSFLLESPLGRVFHSGDVSNTASYLTSPAHIPGELGVCDAVICEATYGDTTSHVSRKSEIKRFAQAVAATLDAGGRVLVPAFALGRSSEVALTLADHMRSGVIPTASIILDGLVRTLHDTMAGELFSYLPDSLRNRVANTGENPFYPPMLSSIKSARQRQSALESTKPMIIIASSGMLSAGVSPMYAKRIVQDEKNMLAFVGYQDDGAPGRRLLELTQQGGDVNLPTGPGRSIERLPVYCKIAAFSFSGHADAGGLVSLIKRYDPRRVVLVHGDGGSRRALGSMLNKRHHVDWPQNGETVDLAAETVFERRAAASPNQVKRRTKLTRFSTQAQVKREGQSLSLTFAEDINVEHLFAGVDTFSVEVTRGERLTVSLREKVEPEI